MWHDWFRKRFAENVSYAEIVRGIITATSREGANHTDWIKREEDLIRQSRESFETNSFPFDVLWMKCLGAKVIVIPYLLNRFGQR